MAVDEGRRITITAIAREAGVSVPTVSRVLNGRSDVSPQTRARVEALLRQHDYRRRRTARPAAKRAGFGVEDQSASGNLRPARMADGAFRREDRSNLRFEEFVRQRLSTQWRRSDKDGCHADRGSPNIHGFCCGSANAVKVLPAGTSRYCRPSSMYVVPPVERISEPS